MVPAGREQVRQCLTNMKRVNRLLMPGGPVRNALVEGALRLAGKWEVLGGLLITALDRPAYAASSDELGYLFDGAVPVALELIDGYCDHIFRGTPLGPRFGRTYGPCEELLARYAQG